MCLGILAIVIHVTASMDYVEHWYGNGCYRLIRSFLDHTIGIMPVPFTFVLGFLALWWIWSKLSQFWRSSPRAISSWARLWRSLLSAIGWIIFFFYAFWGFNYDRIPLMNRLLWEVQPIEKIVFIRECQGEAARLTQLRSDHHRAIEESLLRENFRLLETVIRSSAVELANHLDYDVSTTVPCRQLKPNGLLLRFSTAGFYNPLSGECNIDGGLHPLQKPFVMAHEFFHAMGVTGEGDCNFLAYVLCHRSNDPYVRYSGQLGYWRYLRGSFRRQDRDAYEATVATMSSDVRSDLQAIDSQLAKYPDIMPRLRDRMYHAYLKSNKIHDGLSNYGQIITLVINWRRQGEKL